MIITKDDFAPGVRIPEPDEVIGWMVRDPQGLIVDYGGVTELEMVTELGEAVAEASA